MAANGALPPKLPSGFGAVLTMGKLSSPGAYLLSAVEAGRRLA
jgi:hypothetical protein